MDRAQPSHRDAGLHRILNRAGVYGAVQGFLLRSGARERYVRDFVRPFPGCRILDIGCGPAAILTYLPESIGEYVGFDMNAEYIAAAQRRWGARGRFHCQKVEAATLADTGVYDIVLANGIVHHLNDGEARQLFDIADRALRHGGQLVTYDNVYVENQHWFARWLIARDRGKAVRTRDGYEALARERFAHVESAILHDTLRVPYTILVMSCEKTRDEANA
jgi:SAM-dependent methyltransferase